MSIVLVASRLMQYDGLYRPFQLTAIGAAHLVPKQRPGVFSLIRDLEVAKIEVTMIGGGAHVTELSGVCRSFFRRGVLTCIWTCYKEQAHLLNKESYTCPRLGGLDQHDPRFCSIRILTELLS